MHTALKDLAVTSVDNAVSGLTDFDSAAPAALGLERFSVGAGWLPVFRSQQTCLLVPVQPDPVRLTIRREDGTSDLLLEPGGVAVIPANQPVSIRWHSTLHVLAVWIEPATLREFIEDELDGVIGRRSLEVLESLFDPELLRLARQIDGALQRGGTGQNVILNGLSTVFLATLVRNHGLCDGEGGAAATSRLTPVKLRALRMHVADNLSRRISIAELSELAGLSESSLYREMRDLTGTTPAEFILRTRIRMAHHMVRDTTLPLKQVAAECGFSDQAHLTRTFRKYYGLPPRVMRQRPPDSPGAPHLVSGRKDRPAD